MKKEAKQHILRSGKLIIVAGDLIELEHWADVGRKVDLVTEAAISPYIRKNVFRDLEIIYAAQ